MSRTKPAEVRFYFDADLLGLGKVVSGLRPDVTYPGDPGAMVHKRARPACPVTSAATPDFTWIPIVAAQGWLIVTRDSMIQTRPAEIAAVRSSAGRMVALSGKQAQGTWAQLLILAKQWNRIEVLFGQPGPFIYTATQGGLHKVQI